MKCATVPHTHRLYNFNHMKNYLILAAIIFMTRFTTAQQTIKLYSGTIPNNTTVVDSEKWENHNGITIVSDITQPTLTPFLPSKELATGTAVIIFPGGGYGVNAISHEGTDVAKEFNKWGVAAFVLKYRIPNEAKMTNKEIVPLQDAQRALQIVRERAKEWGINPERIGIMGFSAGGHLASTVGTHFSKAMIDNPANTNLRPDFMILIYPVISFKDDITHMGSRDQLIGKSPSKEKIEFYSNELQVTEKTPPAFLVHAGDDDAVAAENSIRFYQSLLRNKVKTELHLYQGGGHGFGMNNKITEDKWMERLKSWMMGNGWGK